MQQKSDLHSIATILKQHGHTTCFFNIICAIIVGSSEVESSFFPLENGSTIGSAVVVMSKDPLRKLNVIARHSHPVLNLKTNKAYLNIRPHRMTTSAFLMTLDLLDIFIFSRL